MDTAHQAHIPGEEDTRSSRNVDAVKTIYESFDQGNIPDLLARLDPDVEWDHGWGGEPLKWYRQRRGRDDVVSFFDAVMSDFEFARFEPMAFLEGTNRDGAAMVAVPIQLELVVRANRRRIRDLEVHLWTFGPEGLVTRMRHVVDTHQFALATAS